MKIYTLFYPGSYGNFISWCVYSFSELNRNENIISIIDNFNCAHNFRNIEIETIHHYDLKENSYKNFIRIECDQSKIINYQNNLLRKEYKSNLWDFIDATYPDYKKKLLRFWNNTDFWELRELFSYFIDDMIKVSQIKFENYYNSAKHYNTFTINPEKFLLTPEINLENILSFFKLKKHNKFYELNKHVSDYLSKQTQFNKHTHISKFVESTIKNIPFFQFDMTLFDEALIQSKLRHRGYNIKCYNLNDFPKNSIELHKLLE